MTKYNVNIEYSETQYYEYADVIEADSEEEALIKGREEFYSNLPHYETDFMDSEETYNYVWPFDDED